MSKDKFSDYDSTAANNTDVGGVGIQGTNVVSNFDNGLRELMSHIADHFAGDTIASATTTDIGSKAAHAVTVTGTTTITGLGTVKAGTIKFLTFSGALTFTHNATSLILPGAANITTAAGDTAAMLSLGSGNWRCLAYQRAGFGPNNATFRDNEFRVQDDGDNTKQLAFQVSGVTTGTTRTVTWPDRDVDVSKLGLEVIASGSVSSAATLEITGLTSSYRAYTVVFDNLSPATDNVAFWVRLSQDGGSTWDSAASDYANARQVGKSDGTTEIGGSTAAAQIPILTSVGNATSRTVAGEVTIVAPASAGRTRVLCSASYFDQPGLYRDLKSSGSRTNSSAHNAVQFLFSSGNISTMNYTVYGKRAS